MIRTVWLIALLSPWTLTNAVELYRYYNQQGVLVTTDTPPPDAAGSDYEVVNKSGRVLRIVTVLDSGDVQSVAEGKQDSYLLASFSTVEEIRSLQSRKAELLMSEIEQLETSLESLAGRENKIFLEAADIELRGEEVPASVSEQLKILESAKAELIDTLIQRREEYRTLEARYERYTTRFRQLKKEDSK